MPHNCGEFNPWTIRRVILNEFTWLVYIIKSPNQNIGVQYTSEYIPKLQIHQQYPYVEGDTGALTEGEDPIEDLQWVGKMPVAHPFEVEAILDTKVVKSTRKKDYMEYLVKWKKRPTEDSTSMNIVELKSKCFTVVDIMNRGS